MKFDYDMIVIGGGSAGLTAAGMAALLGAKTALVEARRLGGDCTWTGCIPSKTLLKAAKVVHEMRTASRFGLSAISPDVPFPQLMDFVRSLRQRVYQNADAPPHLEKLGVEVIFGSAQFSDSHSINVEAKDSTRRQLSSRYFVIATGSSPKDPRLSETCLTNEDLFELTSLPGRFLILGAGPVGIEMAQAFQRLGSAVTVISPGPHILPGDDPEHATLLQRSLEGEGIEFISGHRATAFERQNGSLLATLDNQQTISCDAALAAIGRQPNVEHLGLENAGIPIEEQGIPVNEHCRTIQRHIFASGDVTGRFQFTHMAEHMSKVAVTNAILRWPATLDSRHIVWSTFTEPEVAHLGESEADLTRRGIQPEIYRFPFEQLDRAITESQAVGEVKVLATPSSQILGASIIGANAGEMISEYALAMRHGLSLSQISSTIHPYPTYLLGNRKAADLASYRHLDSPWLALLGRLFGLRGVRKGSKAL